MERNLDYLKGKHLDIIELYFYSDNEKKETEDVRDCYEIPEKYNIVGKDILGNVLVLHKGKICEIDHEVPKEGPYTVVKNISKFCDFVDELKKYEEVSEDEENIKILKKAKKQLKSLKKMAPKNLRHHFEDPIYEIKDLIDDLKD